jgi:hypothetical protein
VSAGFLAVGLTTHWLRNASFPPIEIVFWGGLVGITAIFATLGAVRWVSHRERINLRGEADQLQPVIRALQEHQARLEHVGQRDELFGRLLGQYDLLRQGLAATEGLSGPLLRERLAAAEHILSELRMLRSARVARELPNQPLIIKTAPNSFRVTFSVPMRIPPRLTFFDIPTGAVPTVTETSAVGFSVVFAPASIPVEGFNFEADARL